MLPCHAATPSGMNCNSIRIHVSTPLLRFQVSSHTVPRNGDEQRSTQSTRGFNAGREAAMKTSYEHL